MREGNLCLRRNKHEILINKIINNKNKSMDFLQNTFWGNSIEAYLLAILIFFVSVYALKIFKSVIIAKIKKVSEKTKTEIDNMVIDAISSIHWPFYVFASLYFSVNFLNVNNAIKNWLFYIFLIAVVYYGIRFVERLINFGIGILSKKQDGEDDTILKLIGTVAKIALWGAAVLLVLSNMGINVTSLIAGMGIGGIAIALALQNILGDLFSSLSIYFDKPFKVGDYVSLGGTNSGTVKKVGIKTTRIETPQGEELVVANSELTKAMLSNFGAMERRRATFNIGVTYDTPLEKLKKITGIIREIIESHGEKTEIARIHFTTFGDFSLIYSATYYVNSDQYNVFADIQQDINFKILEKFEEQNIEMAFPTQTVYVKK